MSNQEELQSEIFKLQEECSTRLLKYYELMGTLVNQGNITLAQLMEKVKGFEEFTRNNYNKKIKQLKDKYMNKQELFEMIINQYI